MKLLTAAALLFSLIVQALCHGRLGGSLEKIADWSSASVLPNQKWYDIDGTEAPLEKILFNNGFTTVRQRHFVGRGIDYDHESNIALAKRAKAAGLEIYIDLHFREGYNDPQTIQCHSAWGSTVESIGKGIYDYCLWVGNSFAQEGIIPKYISLGNEITHGVCDVGNVTLSGGLENSASQGFRDSALKTRTKLMLHLENGWQTSMFAWWFGAIEKAGLPPTAWDVAAMTVYPFYHSVNATQAKFFNSIKTVQSKYKKPVLIVESAWPRMPPPNVLLPTLPPDAQFPISVEGQSRWIRLLAHTARRAGAGGIGYFEGAWLTNPSTGSNFANTLLFDEHGKALPSLATFKTV